MGEQRNGVTERQKATYSQVIIPCFVIIVYGGVETLSPKIGFYI